MPRHPPRLARFSTVPHRATTCAISASIIRPRRCEPGATSSSAVAVDRVKMDAQRHHLLDQRKWRLDMDDARFHRPRAKATHVAPLGNGDCPVLMPPKRPIRPGRFIKQQCPDRPDGMAGNQICQRPNCTARRDDGLQPRDPMQPNPRHANIRLRQDIQQRLNGAKGGAIQMHCATVLQTGSPCRVGARGTAHIHSFSVSSGTILNKSPTRPMSAT